MLAFLGARVVRDGMLDDGTYARAFDEHRVYERLLDAALADPGVSDRLADLTGGLHTTPAEASALVRSLLPPGYVRDEAVGAIRAFLAYLRDDTDDLAVVIHVGPVIERLPALATTVIRQQLLHVSLVPVTSEAQFASLLYAAVASVQDGRLPDALPSASGLTPVQLQTYATLIAPPLAVGTIPAASPDHRAAVLAALTAGDTREALALGLDATMQPVVAAAIERLRGELGPTATVDLVQRMADGNGSTRQEVVDRLLPARRVTSAIATWGYWGALGSAVVLAGALTALFLGRGATLPGWLGAAFTLAGAAGMALHAALGTLLGEALRRLEPVMPGTPAAVQPVIADIVEAVGRHALEPMRTPYVLLLVAGLGLIALAALMLARQRSTRSGF